MKSSKNSKKATGLFQGEMVAPTHRPPEGYAPRNRDAQPIGLFHRDFFLLWLGQTGIALGTQFYAITLVWLVLEATGSGVTLGAVLTVAAIPRATAMLMSGVLIDRVPARLVSLAAALVSTLALVGADGLLLAGSLTLPQVMLLAAFLGLADAFLYPSALALTAKLVRPGLSTRANALMQGADSLANVLGPAAAGLLIGQIGLAPTLLVNAVLFLVGGGLIALIGNEPSAVSHTDRTDDVHYGREVLAGWRYVWSRPPIRVSLLFIALLNFAVLGPVLVGGAVLVESRFGGGADLFGLLSSAFGVGLLTGTVWAGMRGSATHLGKLLGTLGVMIGVCLGALGVVPSSLWAVPVLLGMGLAFGVLYINAVSWLQAQTESGMQGRVASLLSFAAVATDPFSNALAGAVTDLSLTGLFLGAGALVIVVSWFALRGRSLQPSNSEEEKNVKPTT